MMNCCFGQFSSCCIGTQDLLCKISFHSLLALLVNSLLDYATWNFLFLSFQCNLSLLDINNSNLGFDWLRFLPSQVSNNFPCPYFLILEIIQVWSLNPKPHVTN